MKQYGGILTIFILLVIVFGYSYNFVNGKPSTENDYQSENSPTENPVDRAISIGQKIEKKHYYNYETKGGTSLSFSILGKTNHGFCTFMEGNILQGGACRFQYSFIIEDNRIIAKFYESECGRSTTDRTFYYDEDRDVIFTDVNGQRFEFAPEGSQYLRHGSKVNSQSESEPESASNQSESGYTVGENGEVYENAPCSLCGGTGIEKNNSSQTDEYGRVCPQCNGRGHQSY